MHISGAIYTIQDLVNGKILVAHIHNIRPFNFDEERTDPVAVAQQNTQEFVVDRAKRLTLEFRISWSGFGEESDSWEPYKNLMHAEPLHRYLRAHQNTSDYGVSGCGFFPWVMTVFLVGRTICL